MKIECVTEIKVVHVMSDNGYTRNMSLPEIEKWAKEQLGRILVLLRYGGEEPKPYKSDMKLIKVIFTPEEET